VVRAHVTSVPDRGHTETDSPRRSIEDRSLAISQQVLNQLDGIELVCLRRESRNQNLGFNSRPFVLCGLPVRRPPKGQLLFERRNGHFLLQVTGHPEHGLPFGQDRIVPIFLATLAVRQQSQTVRFRSGSEMLDIFGMQKGGKEYRRLVAAFERIFGATIFFGTDGQCGTARVVHMARFAFLQEAQIWYDRAGGGIPSQPLENVIVLSKEFYEEVLVHPIPTDLDAVRVLSGAPAVLDLLMWLPYRCYTAKAEECIPLFGKFGLGGQLGSVEYSRPRRFRARLESWLRIIRALWPECPAEITSDGRGLKIDHCLSVLPSHIQSHIAAQG
jgi:hypothetical protein